MTPVPEHDHTTQEQTLWDLMETGDWDEIEQMRQDAAAAPAPEPKDGETMPTPLEQYETDYANAHAHYQDAHEMPEQDREENTAAAVDPENETARS